MNIKEVAKCTRAYVTLFNLNNSKEVDEKELQVMNFISPEQIAEVKSTTPYTRMRIDFHPLDQQLSIFYVILKSSRVDSQTTNSQSISPNRTANDPRKNLSFTPSANKLIINPITSSTQSKFTQQRMQKLMGQNQNLFPIRETPQPQNLIKNPEFKQSDIQRAKQLSLDEFKRTSINKELSIIKDSARKQQQQQQQFQAQESANKKQEDDLDQDAINDLIDQMEIKQSEQKQVQYKNQHDQTILETYIDSQIKKSQTMGQRRVTFQNTLVDERDAIKVIDDQLDQSIDEDDMFDLNSSNINLDFLSYHNTLEQSIYGTLEWTDQINGKSKPLKHMRIYIHKPQISDLEYQELKLKAEKFGATVQVAITTSTDIIISEQFLKLNSSTGKIEIRNLQPRFIYDCTQLKLPDFDKYQIYEQKQKTSLKI